VAIYFQNQNVQELWSGQDMWQTDMQTDRYADGQICRQTDRQVKQKHFISGIYILNIKRNYTL